MSYILSLKEKKLLQTENFQSLGWVKFRPFKSRIASYHKSQLFFRTGERFKHSNKFYSQVYLFSDTFQKDGRDFQMKVFVKVPCRFIWASDRSKRVSIIVPTNFKFYTTVKVYDPLHLQMVKGLELHPDEAYPVEKIARKAYWGKVYPHSREKYEEVYNRFTETEKANADLRILEKEVFEPPVEEVLDEKNKTLEKTNENNSTTTTNDNSELVLAKKELMNQHLELERQLQERIDEEKRKILEGNNLNLNEEVKENKETDQKFTHIKEEVKEEKIIEKVQVINDDDNDFINTVNNSKESDDDEENDDDEEGEEEKSFGLDLKTFLKLKKEREKNKKKEHPSFDDGEIEDRIRTTMTPELKSTDGGKGKYTNDIDDKFEIDVDEDFVDNYDVSSNDNYDIGYEEYIPVSEDDDELETDFEDNDYE